MMDGWYGGMGAGGWVLMGIFWIVVIALLIWAVSALRDRAPGGRERVELAERPEEILDGGSPPARSTRRPTTRCAASSARRTLRGVRAMRGRATPLLVLAAALAALGLSIAWVTTSADRVGGRRGPDYGRSLTMMGPGGRGMAWYVDGSGRPVSDIAAARAQAQRFADRLGLRAGEVMQFTSNYYVLLDDARGTPATEVLVDPRTGAVTLEYGPAMMWNTDYGMMRGGGREGMTGGGMMGGGQAGAATVQGGMMGRYGGSPDWTPPDGSVRGPLGAAEAQRIANRWLAERHSGLTAAQPDALPGYLTFHTLRRGAITGMLSVNTDTGAVWEHWWHGRFVKMEE